MESTGADRGRASTRDANADERNSDARASLALWLRQARAVRKLTLDDVSRITKIQTRILEKLESGRFDGLPAEVFVRGFVRSFARCVGLDEAEALDRYGKCAEGAIKSGPPVAKALVDSMAELAPSTAMTMSVRPHRVSEVVDAVGAAPIPVNDAVSAPVVASAPIAVAVAVETAPIATTPPSPKKKRTRKRADGVAGTTPPRTRRKKKSESSDLIEAAADAALVADPVIAVGSNPSIEVPLASAAPAVEAAAPSEPEAPSVGEVALEAAPETVEPIEIASEEAPRKDLTPLPSGTWQPTIPAAPSATATAFPWRRPASTAPVVPSLVIDDADPEQAERLQDARNAASAFSAKDQRVSFLPPILLDRDDRSARQGGLTLAVIILIIAATLTLSYLMRRPSASGDGVTMHETPSGLTAHEDVTRLA